MSILCCSCILFAFKTIFQCYSSVAGDSFYIRGCATDSVVYRERCLTEDLAGGGKATGCVCDKGYCNKCSQTMTCRGGAALLTMIGMGALMLVRV